MKTIVLINGSGGCGKSTFIKFCAMLNDKVVELSTVDYVKKVATTLGWDGSKTEKNRKFLHELKMILEEWNDSPNIKVVNAIAKDLEHEIFFINVREKNSIEKLIEIIESQFNYRIHTLLITNLNIPVIQSNKADANVKEYAAYDYVIDNSGTLGQLLDKAGDFLRKIEQI